MNRSSNVLETLASKKLAIFWDHVVGFDRGSDPVEMGESSARTARSGLGTPWCSCGQRWNPGMMVFKLTEPMCGTEVFSGVGVLGLAPAISEVHQRKCIEQCSKSAG